MGVIVGPQGGPKSNPRRNEVRKPEGNLGVLLLQYLEFYGRGLDVDNLGIYIKNGGGFFGKSARGWMVPDRPWLLSIEVSDVSWPHSHGLHDDY